MAVLDQARPQPDPDLPNPGRYETRPELHRIPLMVLARVLWLLGWLAGKVWLATTWVGVAILIGWTDSRETPRQR